MSSTAEAPDWYTVPSLSTKPEETLIHGRRRRTKWIMGLPKKPLKETQLSTEKQGSSYEMLNSDDRSIVDELLKRTKTVPSGNEDDVIRKVLLKHPKYKDWTHVGHNGKGYVYKPEFNRLMDVVKEAWSPERREGDAMRPPGNYERGNPLFDSDQRRDMIAKVFAEKKAA